MNLIGKTIRVRGELRSSEDITVDGYIDGPVRCEGFAFTVGPSGDVTGDVIARDITVFGRSAGRLVATDVVDLRAEATVTGQIISKRFILNDGATFNGRAEPQHLEAAMRVARFQEKGAEAPAGSRGSALR